ncbi:ABC transporter permease subunit [Sporolactobacillus shoreicorticis]|uniref:ABC transporter permease subunit n=1 Tax=Sporolactobacillus shoreicorticis TaxID=1923877 RepID=A0ABW5S5G4_9BACL|nr:ABC transporter permease subunit [Sporolactobacillus shoreicorticis]MCO7124242.1 ABC transporter permease subunit [Sporolactobacillus shoreicorticis]
MKCSSKSKSATLRKMKKYRFVYIMLIPLLLYFCIFSYIPLFMGLIQSFQKSKLLGVAEWSGLENYRELFADKEFMASLGNGFVIGLGTFLLTFIGGLILALLLNEIRNKHLRSLVQTTTYLPYLFSWTIVGGIWVYLLSSHGLANGFLSALSVKPMQFLTEPHYAKLIMVLTGAWKDIGYTAVLFFASIVVINSNLFEAAQIDSASRGKQMSKIILPELVPTMKTICLLGIIGLFTNFDQVYVMGNPAIIDSVRTPLLYIFEKGIVRFDIGVATSASVVLLLVTFLITLVFHHLIFKKEWK